MVTSIKNVSLKFKSLMSILLQNKKYAIYSTFVILKKLIIKF